jgi:hypothetical protein
VIIALGFQQIFHARLAELLKKQRRIFHVTLDEMKKIAEARTSGVLIKAAVVDMGTGNFSVLTPGGHSQEQAERNAVFHSLAWNNWDKLITVIEAVHSYFRYDKRTEITEDQYKMFDAIRALEQKP